MSGTAVKETKSYRNPYHPKFSYYRLGGTLCVGTSTAVYLYGTHSQAISTPAWWNQTEGSCSGLIGSESLGLSKPHIPQDTDEGRSKSCQRDLTESTRRGHGQMCEPKINASSAPHPQADDCRTPTEQCDAFATTFCYLSPSQTSRQNDFHLQP